MWSCEGSGGPQACVEHMLPLKEEVQNAPLICKVPPCFSPLILCQESWSLEVCFALVFVCADMPHPVISVGGQPSRSDDLHWQSQRQRVTLFAWRGWAAIHEIPVCLGWFCLPFFCVSTALCDINGAVFKGLFVTNKQSISWLLCNQDPSRLPVISKSALQMGPALPWGWIDRRSG